MSLIDEYMENFVIIDKGTAEDGYGGVETRYTDGATIQAALSFDNSGEAKIAQALNATVNYTITVKKNIDLDFHTILRRETNGQYYIVVNNGDDNKTPASATLNMKQYTVENFVLPA